MYYDVFLSFRGEDSRVKFISHLHSSLKNAGFYVFKDDDGIRRGDHISVSLLQAISESKICIVVLSKNYGNSKWCMMELERIMEISRTKGMTVVPVFYEVDPSDVRNQTGDFGREFDSLIPTKEVDENTKISWKTALHDVGGRAGVVIKNSRNESEDIKKIVELVTRLLDMTELFVADYPVGVESRVQDVIQLLNNQKSKYPLLLGIWGMGGIGKTTLAKAVYNKIRHDFDGKSFLLNVGEVWKLDNDKVSFQQKLLSDICKTTEIKIATVESGKMILQKILFDKKIFLVIDDVNELDQLNALCGNRNWFGEGSRIIITTRNEDLLSWLQVDDVYKMKEMDDSESVKLFNWHAFKQPIPREGFTNLSRDVVKYSGGLPLALQVIGSFLFTKRTEAEWKSVLEKLVLIPNKEVSEKLKISFDGLSDDDVKDIFLDIAFFFIGMDREDVTEILKDCGHFPEIGINILVQQSLVTVDWKNKIGMHDMIRDMGREIVRKKANDGSKEPSRFWRYEDVLDALSKDTSTLDVKGLGLKMSRMDSTIYLKTKSFEKMDKLRLLQLSGVQLDGDYAYLSRCLRWLSWRGFPLKFIPADFHQDNLVGVDLKYSNLEQVWRKSQLLVKLKFLNLSHSHNLRHTPDFSNLPNLEKLILKDCPSLSSVSSSIGQLKKILLINLKDCTGIRALPKSIYKLDSVKTFILSGCPKIDELEEDIVQMKSLTTLLVDTTDIKKEKLYDVLLSFSGKENSAKFISNLHSCLQNAEIDVFKDNNGIHRGDQISVSLLQAISQSKICIVVLSRNYGNSKWCMMELERIVEINRTNDMVVVPVFYEVDPSDVRNQTGEFGEAFDSLISTKKVDENPKVKWKTALHEVGGRAGIAIKNSRNESEDIEKIVELVTRLLDMTELFVADHPVGVESRVQDIIQLLNSQKSKGPLLLGIWGMGGIGKTTIAKAIYNEIRHDFEARSFLFNFGEVGKLDKVSLQQQLLSNIYKTTIQSGNNILRERLRGKKMLIVLDDVIELDQMDVLCENLNWFGTGSRIIITTRDERLLRTGVDHVYKMKEMDDSESLELFNWHAFKQPIPREGFTNLSREVVKYSGGLPLALKAIGSFLFTKRMEAEWKSVLEKLKLIPNDEVSKKLRICFDALSGGDITDEQNNSLYCQLSNFEDLKSLQCLWLKCDSEAQLNQIVASISSSNIGTSASIHCHSQVCISSSKYSLTSLLIQMGMSCNVTSILRENILQKMSPIGSGLLPGDNYPNWLTFNSNSSSVTFEVPEVDGRNLKTIMCIVYSSSADDATTEGFKVVLVINYTKNTIQIYKRDGLLATSDEEEWQRVIENIAPGNKIKVAVGFTNELIVKKTTIYLVYDEPNEEKTNHCHETDENDIVFRGDENRVLEKIVEETHLSSQTTVSVGQEISQVQPLQTSDLPEVVTSFGSCVSGSVKSQTSSKSDPSLPKETSAILSYTDSPQEMEGENQSESRGYSPPHSENNEDNQDSTDSESSHASYSPKETMNETKFPSVIQDDHVVPLTGIQISNVAIPPNIPIDDELQTGLAAFNIEVENNATAAIESFLSSLGFSSGPIVSTSQSGASSQLTTTAESLVQELQSLAFDGPPFDSLSSILALDQSLDSFKQKFRVHQHLLPASQLEGFTAVLTNLEDIVKTYRGYEQQRTLEEHSESEVAKFVIAMTESKDKLIMYQDLISDSVNRDKEIITKVEALKKEIEGLEMEQVNLKARKESAIENTSFEKRALRSQAASLTAHQSQLQASRDKLSTLDHNLQQCKATYARFKEHPPF